jgi:hypothetical protein
MREWMMTREEIRAHLHASQAIFCFLGGGRVLASSWIWFWTEGEGRERAGSRERDDGNMGMAVWEGEGECVNVFVRDWPVCWESELEASDVGLEVFIVGSLVQR